MLVNSNKMFKFAAMKQFVILATLLFSTLTGTAGNRIYVENVRSLTSMVNGDWMNRPVMELGSDDKLRIGFDELSHDYHRFVYRLEHCEADWTASDDLFESDWLEGFNDNPIDDYQNSINTTVMYTHYTLTIPNERCRLKMSGNYRLTVMDEDQDNERVLEVEFYVVEPLMSVGLNVTTNTDVDHNQSHQQLSMSVKYNGLRVNNVDEEICTVVMQNWREDKSRHNIHPNFTNGLGLTWEHNKALIFDAGNEFHKFEMLDVSHTTMGLDRMEWNGKNYEAWPFTATVRRNYLTDVAAKGAFVIRNSDNREVDYTCDYVWVNYELAVPYEGDIYISGLWTIDNDREYYRMTYDPQTETYKARIMQKQGYYSYQFLDGNGNIPSSEGSFFQTGNQYQVMIYYKGTGARTWRLVGYRALEFR